MHLRDVFHKIHSHENGQATKLVPETSIHLSVAATYFLLFLMAIYLTNCQKTITYPVTEKYAPVPDAQAPDFTVSVSNIALYQDNENIPAFTCNWSMSNVNTSVQYSIEAASSGTGFADPIEIATCKTSSVSITAKDANQFFSKLVPAGQTDMIELRLKVDNGNNSIVYSVAQAMKVSTYENFIEYQIPQYMHVPGNYQNWDLTDAPHIVTRNNDGMFEGYINFTNNNPQFLLLKDVNWIPVNTYTNIGAGKFGFNGKMFSLSNGAGIYLLRANSNTNCWNATKINSFGVSGTAVTKVNDADPKMLFDSATKSWSITTHLQKGNFRIRANNSDTISFGKNMALGYMIPDYNGSDFMIVQPGNYTIVLNLHFAGDYLCTVTRRPDNLLN